MFKRLLISIGAGLAAAVFFIVPMKGTMAAGLTMLFAPLPLMVAGLSFTPSTAIAGAVAGALLVWSLVNEYYAVFFLLWAGVPAFWLTRLAWLARPANPGETADEQGLVWYPLGHLALWSAALGAGVALALVFTGSAYFGGFAAFQSELTRALAPIIELAVKAPSAPKMPEGASVSDIAGHVAFVMPAVMAAWATLAYGVNLWCAGRVAGISQSQQRPWHDLPEHLRMPRAASAAFAIALVVAALTTGLPRSIGIISLAALAMAMALQGFAILHHQSRKLQARYALLSALYLATVFFFPAPLVVAAVLGLAHGLMSRTALPSR